MFSVHRDCMLLLQVWNVVAECPGTLIGYIRGRCISQFHSSCHITSLTYSMTSTRNYCVAPEFAMAAVSNSIHH